MRPHNLKLVTGSRPRSFTKPEAVLDAMREALFMDGRTYKVIAKDIGVSATTIGNIATGHTRWPRPTTLFPLMHALGIRMEIILPQGVRR
jgi:transcriptional regulator with XRE-family HTH domain